MKPAPDALLPSIPPDSCFRGCGARYSLESEADRAMWIQQTRDGRVVRIICGRCASQRERAEAVINDATLDCGRTPDGRITLRPKVTAADLDREEDE